MAVERKYRPSTLERWATQYPIRIRGLYARERGVEGVHQELIRENKCDRPPSIVFICPPQLDKSLNHGPHYTDCFENTVQLTCLSTSTTSSTLITKQTLGSKKTRFQVRFTTNEICT